MEESKKTREITLRELGQVFLKCWWVMLIVAVAAASLTAVLLVKTHKDHYTAETRLWVMRAPSDGIATSTGDVSISIYIVKDVIDNIDSFYVLDSVREIVPYKEEALKKMISVKHEEGLQTFYVDATAVSPEEARNIADLVADSIVELVNYTLFDGENYVRIIDRAKLPTKISNPIQWRLIPLAFLVGALAVYGIYLMIRLLSDRIDSAEDVANYLDISVLGEIPNMREVRRHKNRYGSYYANEYAAAGGEKKG